MVEEGPGKRVYRIGKITNVGKGLAYHIDAEADLPGEKPKHQGGPTVEIWGVIQPGPLVATQTGVPVPALPVNATSDPNWVIHLKWNPQSTGTGDFHGVIRLTVGFVDMHGRHYKLIHEFR